MSKDDKKLSEQKVLYVWSKAKVINNPLNYKIVYVKDEQLLEQMGYSEEE